jgi:phospholipase/carboxylesterase
MRRLAGSHVLSLWRGCHLCLKSGLWRVSWCLILLLALGCGGFGEEVPSPRTRIEPRQEVRPPPEYTGPIDPEWPPSRPSDFLVLLEESRLLREEYRSRNHESGKPVRGVRESPELFVESGKIGDFEYLEVIMGPMKHPDDPMPLIVVLHGRGGRPKIPSRSFRETLPLRFFIPQAPDKVGDGFTWIATWTNSPEKQLFARSLSARADQLAPAIKAFMRLRPTLGKPIVTGFSQGGIMSFALATRYPDQFAAAFPLAGWLPPVLYPTMNPKQKYPYIYAQHGSKDTVVPTNHGRATVRSLRARGLKVDYREVAGVGHVVTPGMDEEVHRATRRFLSGYFAEKRPVLTRPTTRAPAKK